MTDTPLESPLSDTPPETDYVTVPWWREVLDRAARNAVQALIPTLLVLATGTGAGINTAAVVWTVLIAAAVSVLKALLVVPPDTDGALWRRLLDRALPAAAAAALSYLTIDGTTPVADLDWRLALIGVAGSTLLAVGQSFASPPTRARYTLVA